MFFGAFQSNQISKYVSERKETEKNTKSVIMLLIRNWMSSSYWLHLIFYWLLKACFSFCSLKVDPLLHWALCWAFYQTIESCSSALNSPDANSGVPSVTLSASPHASLFVLEMCPVHPNLKWILFPKTPSHLSQPRICHKNFSLVHLVVVSCVHWQL